MMHLYILANVPVFHIAYRWIILGKEGKAGNDPCNFHTKHLEITTGQKLHGRTGSLSVWEDHWLVCMIFAFKSLLVWNFHMWAKLMFGWWLRLVVPEAYSTRRAKYWVTVLDVIDGNAYEALKTSNFQPFTMEKTIRCNVIHLIYAPEN